MEAEESPFYPSHFKKGKCRMKNTLIRMLALALCFCTLLSFAACGEDAPLRADDDITPPANDTPTADEPEEPNADEPAADEPEHPNKPAEPDTPTEPSEPTIPDLYMLPVPTPIKPDTPVNYEKWSSLDAQAILSQYERVLRGEEMVYNTTTKKEEYFDDPENNPDTVWGRAWITIVDFDQNGIPEILVKFSNDSMPFYALYYLNDKIYLDYIQRSSATGLYKDYVFCSSGGIYNHYYNVYELTETGLRYNEIAMSNAKQALSEDGTPQLEYIYQLNGENVTKEEFDAFLEWLEEDSAEPYIPNEPTESTDNPAEPDEPDTPTEPSEPTTSVAPEKWSSPEALEILSDYISVIRGQKTMIDTYTKEETIFSNPGEKTFSIWDETHVSIVDFNLDGLPEIIFTTGVFTFDGYDVLYSIGGKIYHSTLSFRGVDYVYKDHIIACGSGDNVYYDTYEPTETGLSINRIAKSLVFQDVQKGLIFSYALYGNEVTEEQFTAWVNSLGEATPPLITYWM